jgi:hypothetical protein
MLGLQAAGAAVARGLGVDHVALLDVSLGGHQHVPSQTVMVVMSCLRPVSVAPSA